MAFGRFGGGVFAITSFFVVGMRDIHVFDFMHFPNCSTCEMYDYILAVFFNMCYNKVAYVYICSKPIGVEDDDALIYPLPSTSIAVNLSLIFFATTLEFSISFW